MFIGAGSVIGEGCKIERGAIIAPNSFVPPGRVVPGNQLWSGNPIKFVRELDSKEAKLNYVTSLNNWELAQKHSNNFNVDESENIAHSYLSENYFKWRGKYYH